MTTALAISAALGWLVASLSARGWVIPAIATWQVIVAVYFIVSGALGLG